MSLTPQQIVQELDKHIIGQAQAKRAVALALRNRWRRLQVEEALRPEITPKNILMIGPTGVGKTEIARRLATLAQAPFLKVEATKFTEVGYVGRDVDSIIRDLVELAIKMVREEEKEKQHTQIVARAEERLLDALLGPVPTAETKDEGAPPAGASTRCKFLEKLRSGELNDKEIEIELEASRPQLEIFSPPGMEELTQQLQGLFHHLGRRTRSTRKLRVEEALKQLIEEEGSRALKDDEIKTCALQRVEQNGIVFLDEIDKTTSRGESASAEVSRQGVQRDLLPLVEGTTVSTKYGMVKTDHILFIASGAFHLAKPSDLLPELQGRFPIRVELESLSVEDFVCILTRTDACLTRQYKALLATEGVELIFQEDALKRIAEIAWTVNEKTENLGARRLYTVMEKLLEPISFEASVKNSPMTLTIDAVMVNQQLAELAEREDMARYVL